ATLYGWVHVTAPAPGVNDAVGLVVRDRQSVDGRREVSRDLMCGRRDRNLACRRGRRTQTFVRLPAVEVVAPRGYRGQRGGRTTAPRAEVPNGLRVVADCCRLG